MDSSVPPGPGERPAGEPARTEPGTSPGGGTPPTQGPGPGTTEPRPRRRDRHGRGMRGPIAPPQVPLALSRAETFRDLVRDSVERLERRLPQLADVDFLVLDVPGVPEETVPLGDAVPAERGRPARIVIYRRPVEIRTKNRDERALLVHEVVVEQVAELLGLAPESVDPRYGQD
ncbi:metallopeptidase family protein [Streptomyces sp. NPDC048057]|uniref:metallopeptidase family protein n=1 Tax=Streptomyces sp. NPDC048057 TaxID=3155628 RepID=UPI0033C3D52E